VHTARDAIVFDARMGLISSRTGAALALVVSVLALALGSFALLASFRDDDDVSDGRLVQTRLTPGASEQPVLFELDGFYVSTGDDGRLRALYVYPPGFFGHNRGCRVEWRPFEAPATEGQAPGMFVEPCGGARFDRGGALVSGPAERGLDEFKTEPGIEGVIVDTGVLYCGPAAGAAPPTAAAIDREECDRVDAAR
jgi:hypothetical protein